MEASNELKLAANKQFAVKDYSSAISTYDKAIGELPIYLDYELAVLQSNISACHIGLKEWKDAIESAEKGLDCLEREMPTAKPKEKPKPVKDTKKSTQPAGSLDELNVDDQVVELPDDTTEEDATALLKQLNISDVRRQDITRIRSKLLLRRARSNVMLCEQPPPPKATPTTSLNEDTDLDLKNPAFHDSPHQPSAKSKSPFAPKSNDPPSHWSHLSSALSDYTTLSKPPYVSLLPPSDRKTVNEMLRTLPSRVEVAKKKEVDEMMGKLKELGNGILKPFGLSTDMFKMTQDPNTGGWSMGFDGKASKG